MNTDLVLPAPPSTEPPVDDLEAWARRFILTPAATSRERHERFVVAQLLADLEATR